MRRMYKQIRMHESTMDLIDRLNRVICEFSEQGFTLTVRQVYYQGIAQDLFPESWRNAQGTKNNMHSYKKLVDVCSKARMCGMMDWDAIEDRTRFLRGNSHWESPAEIVRSCADQFRIDLRIDQPEYIEVWIEKDALVGVLEDVCSREDVPYYACRGYSSLVMLKRAAERIECEMSLKGRKSARIIYLGDHDPSGLDMDRDIFNRVSCFRGGAFTTVERIALTMDQIEEQGPPPSPAKVGDSRANEYVQQYGHDTWELDALKPQYIEELVKKTIDSYTDKVKMGHREELQIRGRSKLDLVAVDLERDEDTWRIP